MTRGIRPDLVVEARPALRAASVRGPSDRSVATWRAAQVPALSREEEQELSRRYRATGDREALFRLVTSNLMQVVRVALSFRRAARNLLDLVQEGNLGLLAAIERFDPELGVRLPTYAAWWIRAYIVKFLLDNVRLVRVGTTNARRKLLRNLRQEKSRLEAAGFEGGPRCWPTISTSGGGCAGRRARPPLPGRLARRAAGRFRGPAHAAI